MGSARRMEIKVYAWKKLQVHSYFIYVKYDFYYVIGFGLQTFAACVGRKGLLTGPSSTPACAPEVLNISIKTVLYSGLDTVGKNIVNYVIIDFRLRPVSFL